MNSSSSIEIRRCRPLLGTFVEITASGLETAFLQTAVNRAFDAIQQVQHLLSVHDPESELSRLNRDATFHPVKVSELTFTVIEQAHRLAAESEGAFDPTVAPMLARWGLLPATLRRNKPGTWRDVRLLPRDTPSRPPPS